MEFVDAKTLRVLELYIISNPGNKTVVAAKEGDPVLSFQLPEGATNLQFEDGTSADRYITIPDGFGDTVPVRPGSGNYQVMYSYELPYNRKLDLFSSDGDAGPGGGDPGAGRKHQDQRRGHPGRRVARYSGHPVPYV